MRYHWTQNHHHHCRRPLALPAPPFLQAALLASDFISCQQQLFLMARTACKQLARSPFCSSATYITPLLASSAACQRFHFLPAAIISHGKICLQEAGKKSILLFQLLAMRSYFCWQANYLLASSAA